MQNDDDIQAILARRARFIALALAGVGTATQATACVCLSLAYELDAGPDAPFDANVDAPGPDAYAPDVRYVAVDAPVQGPDSQAALDGASTGDEDAAASATSEDASSGDAPDAP